MDFMVGKVAWRDPMGEVVGGDTVIGLNLMGRKVIGVDLARRRWLGRITWQWRLGSQIFCL